MAREEVVPVVEWEAGLLVEVLAVCLTTCPEEVVVPAVELEAELPVVFLTASAVLLQEVVVLSAASAGPRAEVAVRVVGAEAEAATALTSPATLPLLAAATVQMLFHFHQMQVTKSNI